VLHHIAPSTSHRDEEEVAVAAHGVHGEVNAAASQELPGDTPLLSNSTPPISNL
jgi:hypothetical protein